MTRAHLIEPHVEKLSRRTRLLILIGLTAAAWAVVAAIWSVLTWLI